MNNRDRIINTVLFKEVDRLPFFFYFPPWDETIERWKTEGMSSTQKWNEGIGADAGIVIMQGVNLGFCPAFTERIVEERADTRIIVDDMGVTKEIRKSGSSVPRYLEFPVKNQEDWERIKKERLSADNSKRFSADWLEICRKYNDGDELVQLGSWPFGLFGTLRELMGVEECLVSFHEQPELIHDIMDYLTDFWIDIYRQVNCHARIDCIHMWEDMSGCNGSLISPKMVREFMMPNYKKIRAFMDEVGIPVFALDTDGDCSELVPLFLECGINLIMPFEVAAGSDILDYRRKYPDLCILGGIDKRELAKDEAAIEKELERVGPMFWGGGYIPAIDHFFHPEISWQNYLFFVERLKCMIGVK